MANQLIPVSQSTINNQSIQTVNARDLHEFLGVNSKFADWIKNQIERARLVENRDFVTVSKKIEAAGNRGLTIDYHLTIEAGKSIGMMSATDKGFQIRDYFLECERVAKSAFTIPQTLHEALALASEQAKIVYDQQQLIAVLEPKADFYDCVTTSNDLCDMATVAKVLAIPMLGRNTLFQILRNLKVLQHDNRPYQKYVDRGYFRVTESKWDHPKTEAVKISFKTEVTQKGLDFLRSIVAHNISKDDGRWNAPAKWGMPSRYHDVLVA